jgi:hypothetical protein
MANFVLFPCKLRQDHLIPKKDGEPLSLDWKGLVEKLAPSRSHQAMMILHHVRLGSFVGLIKRDGRLNTFYLYDPTLNGSLREQLKKDPTMEERLVEVWRVDHVRWDAVVTEKGTGARP